MEYILSFLSLMIGIMFGWIASEKYTAYLQHNEHEFDQLFEENPHPEIFNKKGKIDKGEYITMVFDPDFDPEQWNPETDIEIEE